MNIPNIPTDNLYKYAAVLGFVSTIFFIVWPIDLSIETINETQKLDMEISVIRIENSKLQEEWDSYNESSEEMTKEVDLMVQENNDRNKNKINNDSVNENKEFSDLNILMDYVQTKELREIYDFITRHEDRLYKKHFSEIEEKYNNANNTHYKIEKAKEIIKGKLEMVRTKYNYIIISIIVSFIMIICSFFLSRWGFKQWIKKQKIIDDITYIEYIKLKREV